MKVFITSTVALAAVAMTPALAALPASVAALLDTKASPCTDFYQYACGGWIKANALGPEDVSKDYSFSSVAEKNEVVIESIVKEDWPLVGEFWDSCRDQASLEALGAKPLQPYLNKIAGASSREAVMRLAGELSRTGVKFVTDYDVAGDYKDAKNNMLYLGDPKLVLPDTEYYYDAATFAAIEPKYRKYISTVLSLAGYNPNGSSQGGQQGGQQQGGAASPAANAKYFGDAVLGVEMKLANMLTGVAEQTGDDAYYNPIKIGEMMAKYPLSVGAYFNGAGFLEKSKLTKESKVIAYYFDYFQLAEATLASIDIKDLKTYLAFLYINNRVRYLNNAFYDAYFEFFAKFLNGQQSRSPTDSVCVYRVKQFFPDLIGKYYFMKMFDKEREDNTQLMTKLVENAMSDHIGKLGWLDDNTRREALVKLGKVANLIGQSTVKKNYPFYLSRDTFFNNIQSILTNDFDTFVKKLGNLVDRDLWSISPAEVNAYYSPLENKMVFPAAILQSPFFDGKAHPAQNFGSIGAVIGHELTHGFDSSGRRFDGDGNKRNWWTPETTKEFQTRAECMQDQYSSFAVKGEDGSVLINVNGNTTIGENIADNGGFSLTWDAYHEYAKTAKFNNPLSDLEANQTLFLSFAQTWCGLSRDGAMLNLVKTDPHSPGQWRANGVAMNSDHFGQAFNCPKGTPMNPEAKCQLW